MMERGLAQGWPLSLALSTELLQPCVVAAQATMAATVGKTVYRKFAERAQGRLNSCLVGLLQMWQTVAFDAVTSTAASATIAALASPPSVTCWSPEHQTSVGERRWTHQSFSGPAPPLPPVFGASDGESFRTRSRIALMPAALPVGMLRRHGSVSMSPKNTMIHGPIRDRHLSKDN